MPRFCLAVLIFVLAATFGGTSARAAGGEPDPALVARAKAGDANAAYQLGCLYDRGDGVEQDFETAAHWYGFAAEKQHILALIDLGTMRLHGEGMEEDRDLARQLFVKAAEAGSVEATYIVGQTFLKDSAYFADDTPQSRRAIQGAARWYRRAADEGLPEAQHVVAILIDRGDVVPRDPDEGWNLLADSAEQGYPPAQRNVAEIYRRGGGGVLPAPQLAAEWHREAAEQGYDLSMLALAKMYLAGEGVPTDAAEAARWFRRLAEWTFFEAGYYLGILYLEGEGVPKNEAEALYWFELAARVWNEAAIEQRDALKGRLPKDVADAAHQRARVDARRITGLDHHMEVAYRLAAPWSLPMAWGYRITRGPKSRLCGQSGLAAPIRPYPVTPDSRPPAR